MHHSATANARIFNFKAHLFHIKMPRIHSQPSEIKTQCNEKVKSPDISRCPTDNAANRKDN
jgi:hypothetical protein